MNKNIPLTYYLFKPAQPITESRPCHRWDETILPPTTCFDECVKVEKPHRSKLITDANSLIHLRYQKRHLFVSLFTVWLIATTFKLLCENKAWFILILSILSQILQSLWYPTLYRVHLFFCNGCLMMKLHLIWHHMLGPIHSHFVHSISNSTVDHFHIDSINAHIFCTGCLMMKMPCILHRMIFNVE